MMRLLVCCVLGVSVALGVSIDCARKSADPACKHRAFSFVGARDFVRFFTPAPTPIAIDSRAKELESSLGVFPLVANPFAPFIHDKSPESLAFAPSAILRISAKAFEKELASRKRLLQAQAVLFQAMRDDRAKRDDKEIYLTLAMLEYRLNGFYHLRTLAAYIRAYLHAGGSKERVPKPLVPFLDSRAEVALPSFKRVVSSLLLEHSTNAPAASAHWFVSSYGQSQEAFVRIFTQGARSCVGIITKDSKGVATTQGVACLPYFVDELLLLPFDERLYIIGGDRIYLVPSPLFTHPAPTYAIMHYQEKNRPNLCPYSAQLRDEGKEEHLASDLARAGYGVDSSKKALSKWQEDFALGDETMRVEYLGYIDVFNDGSSVPVARTHTSIVPHLPLYEAFTLDPTSLQADIVLSHPSMAINGRIASLFFIRYEGEIVGCVRDERHREERLFRFYKDSPPKLIKHNHLESSLHSIEEIAPLPSAPQSACYFEGSKHSSNPRYKDSRYGLLALGEQIISQGHLCDETLQKALVACKNLAAENDALECRLDRINKAIENVL